jgi:hypothetical protein
MGFWATTCCCLGPFWWESPRGWDFRPQLVVVSGLFGGNPLVDGVLGHNLLLSRAFFHDGILAIMKSFSRTFFLFSRWNSGYHKAFVTNFFLFSRWNSGYHKAFVTNFFFFFSMEFWLSQSLCYELFSFFHDGILAITKSLLRTFFFFHDGALEIRNLGEDSFYTYITKSIYIGSASLKTLPLDLEPPLQGKEYGPSYSTTTKKRKANVFSRNHL